MDKEKLKKEFCIYIKNGRGSPYTIGTYNSFREAFIALNNMLGLEQERNRFYYVDNDFYDNKYPPNMFGKYFCIMERNVTEWIKHETLASQSSKDKDNKIIMFRQKI